VHILQQRKTTTTTTTTIIILLIINNNNEIYNVKCGLVGIGFYATSNNFNVQYEITSLVTKTTDTFLYGSI